MLYLYDMCSLEISSERKVRLFPNGGEDWSIISESGTTTDAGIDLVVGPNCPEWVVQQTLYLARHPEGPTRGLGLAGRGGFGKVLYSLNGYAFKLPKSVYRTTGFSPSSFAINVALRYGMEQIAPEVRTFKQLGNYTHRLLTISAIEVHALAMPQHTAHSPCASPIWAMSYQPGYKPNPSNLPDSRDRLRLLSEALEKAGIPWENVYPDDHPKNYILHPNSKRYDVREGYTATRIDVMALREINNLQQHLESVRRSV